MTKEIISMLVCKLVCRPGQSMLVLGKLGQHRLVRRKLACRQVRSKQLACRPVRSKVLDDGVETVVVVSGVFNGAGGTVGFQKAVGSFDVTVSVAVFGLALDVVCGWVVYAVFEVVWCWGVCGFWSVGLWCGVSWCRVSGLVSWGGVLGESRSHASGEDDQLSGHFCECVCS
ncbi:Uncharacterized protein FWK35_00014790, partial [Aphis craccivora]